MFLYSVDGIDFILRQNIDELGSLCICRDYYCKLSFDVIIRDLISGTLYHVEHQGDDSTTMQHSILYFANIHDKTTSKKHLTLILSSPLNDREVRKQWKVNTIKQIVQFDAGIKLVFCKACYQPATEEADLEFILLVPASSISDCLKFICQNSCFTLASSDEDNIVYCKNDEHDKVCLQTSTDNGDSAVETTGMYQYIMQCKYRVIHKYGYSIFT